MIEKNQQLYKQPDEHSKMIRTFPKEIPIKILKEKPLWLYVSGTDFQHKSFKRWISKKDLFGNDPMPYSSETADFKFYALGLIEQLLHKKDRDHER